MNPQSAPEYFTPKELASHLNMSIKWVEKYTQARRIPGQVRIGGSWRYNRLAVQQRLAISPIFLLGGEGKKKPFRGQ